VATQEQINLAITIQRVRSSTIHLGVLSSVLLARRGTPWRSESATPTREPPLASICACCVLLLAQYLAGGVRLGVRTSRQCSGDMATEFSLVQPELLWRCITSGVVGFVHSIRRSTGDRNHSSDSRNHISHSSHIARTYRRFQASRRTAKRLISLNNRNTRNGCRRQRPDYARPHPSSSGVCGRTRQTAGRER
jgi:hypothetical protein